MRLVSSRVLHLVKLVPRHLMHQVSVITNFYSPFYSSPAAPPFLAPLLKEYSASCCCIKSELDAIFSPQLDQLTARKHLSSEPSASLVGEPKVLVQHRAESPSQRGSKVKARPHAGMETQARERAKRREHPPPSNRQSPRNLKFPSALYIDADGIAAQSGVNMSQQGEHVGRDMIVVFPPTPQLRWGIILVSSMKLSLLLVHARAHPSNTCKFTCERPCEHMFC